MWVASHNLLGPCCVCDVIWAVSSLRTGHHIDTAVPSQDWGGADADQPGLNLAWWLQPHSHTASQPETSRD